MKLYMEDIMKDTIIKKLNERYTLEKREMGELGKIHKGMFQFDSEAYEIKDIGNLFIMDMKAMLGLMKMKTAVLCPVYKDLSFCNIDTVNVLSKGTYMFEMYESCIKDSDLSSFEPIRERYRDLPEMKTEPRWYDDIRLDSSICKSGKKIDVQGRQMVLECLRNYIGLLKDAEDCDLRKKIEKNAEFALNLLEKGGPAVNSMSKIIGKEKTAELVRRFMYGLED